MVAKGGPPTCKVWKAGPTKSSSPLTCGHGEVSLGRNYAGIKRVNKKQSVVETAEAEPKRSNVK